jgi:hypothetical protein
MMFPIPPLLRVKFPKFGRLLLRHPNLIAHQYRYVDKDKKHPPNLWIRRAEATLPIPAPIPLQASPLIATPTPQRQPLVQAEEKEKASMLEHPRQEVEEKEPTLGEVRSSHPLTQTTLYLIPHLA